MLQLSSLVRLPRVLALAAALAMPLAVPAAADPDGLEKIDLPPLPKGEAVLEVSSAEGVRSYDLATLEDLGAYRLTTGSLWDQDVVAFEGVLLADLLADAGLADVAAVELTAADDYSQVIPHTDWTTYPVLVATREDGALLAGTERGPMRIVYPLSAHPELDTDDHHARWVWSLVRIKAVED